MKSISLRKLPSGIRTAVPERRERLLRKSGEIWRKSASVRLAVWAVLLAGSVAAAFTSCAPLAAGCAVARAGLAGFGTFFTLDAAFRTLGFEKNSVAVSAFVALAVTTVLSIPGTGVAAESAVRLAVPESPMPLRPPTAPDALVAWTASFHSGVGLPRPEFRQLLDRVFADIRNDHPSQPWVTLEQSVRRLEGLKLGIPLSESGRLVSELPSVSALVSHPAWDVVRAMHAHGILPATHDGNGSFEAVSKRMTRSQIADVLETAYAERFSEFHLSGEGSVHAPSCNDALPCDSLDSANPSRKSPVPVSQDGALLPRLSPSNRPQADSGSWVSSLFAPLVSAIACVAGFLGVRKFRNRPRNSVRPDVTASPSLPSDGLSARNVRESIPPIPEKLPAPSPHSENSDRTVFPISNPGPKSTEISNPSDSGSVNSISALAAFGSLAEEYGFLPTDCESRALCFQLPTPGGSLLLEKVEGSKGSGLRLAWLENGNERFSSRIGVSESGRLQNDLAAYSEALDEAYFLFASYRETVKREEFRNVRKFVVSSRDLRDIYRQLERPETVSTERETGGFWFSSPYSVSDGTFRFRGLANPDASQIDATSAEFAIRSESWETYAAENLSKAFRSEFAPGERRLLSRALSRTASLEGDGFRDANPFPLAVDYFNWHKHPWGPIGPSWSDLNHPASASGKFEDSPTLPVVTFAIANPLPKSFVSSAYERASEAGNALVLRGRDFGPGGDYLITFWKLVRPSESEKRLREKFTEVFGISESAKLGICRNDGSPLHLDRAVSTAYGVFGPDLRQVKVSVEG